MQTQFLKTLLLNTVTPFSGAVNCDNSQIAAKILAHNLDEMNRPAIENLFKAY
jgi:hypothetical protein